MDPQQVLRAAAPRDPPGGSKSTPVSWVLRLPAGTPLSRLPAPV